jgi:NAD(P)-dependent dehydrogenase (short-subunit alcohol dehydrogenase family)
MIARSSTFGKADGAGGAHSLGYPPGGFYKARVEKAPLKRAGTVHEIAAMATFLCSDDGDYITGQTCNVDGGSVLNYGGRC